MLLIYENPSVPDIAPPSRWFQLTEIVLYPEISSILVTAYGVVDPNEIFMVMDIKTKVVTPEKAKIELDQALTKYLEKGYKTVENTRFRAVFKQ